MESIGSILERMLKDDFLNEDDMPSPEDLIDSIYEADEDITAKVEDVKSIQGKNNIIKIEVLTQVIDLLIEYGSFKRIPAYYKVIDGQSQDYKFFTDCDKREIRGFRVTERNVRRDGKFITEELYILDTGDFYQFSSETINRNNYKECFREQDYDLPNPFDEWDFYKVISKILTILNVIMQRLDNLEYKERVLSKFLDRWSKELNEIANI